MDRVRAAEAAAPRRFAAVGTLLVSAVAASACALNQQGVQPPNDTFFYPTSALVDPTGDWMFVADSNADLRYNDGTLVIVNIGADGAAGDRAKPAGTFAPCPQGDYTNPLPRSDPSDCCWDRIDPNILNCDERRYTLPDATTRIGSFSAGMVWEAQSTFAPCTGNSIDPTFLGRLLIGVRGNTSLTFVDVLEQTGASHPDFRCASTVGDLVECDTAHQLTETTSSLQSSQSFSDPNPPTVNLPDEPYALALDASSALLYVGHLVGSTSTVDTGGISLFDVSGTAMPSNASAGSAAESINPEPPQFVGPFPSPFSPNSAGAYGITALTLHPSLELTLHAPSGTVAAANEVYASSRYVPLVASETAVLGAGASNCDRHVTDIPIVPAGESFNTGLTGSEMRGVTFFDAQARAFALQRVPPALVGFDIVEDQAGAVSTIPTDINETCSSPTFLYQHEVTAAEGPRIYVSCFDTGEIYVFDPTVPSLVTTFQVGRGPAGMVFSPTDSSHAYVLEFSDNDISVVDLAPGSATQYHVIQRLGFPSTTPR
jgi:hypothetical protein